MKMEIDTYDIQRKTSNHYNLIFIWRMKWNGYVSVYVKKYFTRINILYTTFLTNLSFCWYIFFSKLHTHPPLSINFPYVNDVKLYLYIDFLKITTKI